METKFELKLRLFLENGGRKLRQLHDDIWGAALGDERLDEAQYDDENEHRDLHDRVERELWSLYSGWSKYFLDHANNGRNLLGELLAELESEMIGVLKDNFIEYYYKEAYQSETIESKAVDNQLALFQ